jgi:hypothetical protein
MDNIAVQPPQRRVDDDDIHLAGGDHRAQLDHVSTATNELDLALTRE